MKYLFVFIFSYIHSGGEAKRGVEFRHSARKLPTLLCAGYSVILIYYIYYCKIFLNYIISIESKHEVTILGGLNEFCVKFFGPPGSEYKYIFIVFYKIPFLLI